MILLNKINKTYGKEDNLVYALRDVSLEIKEGEMVAIIGPSGSGKSTLLNIIGCLDKADSGSYKLDGDIIEDYSLRRLARVRNEVFGFVLQDFALVDKWKVSKNVAIPLDYSDGTIKNKKERVEEILSKLGILDKKNAIAANLSGGQRQRTAIARAVINNPRIILADEPTGSVDRKTGEEILKIFKEINNEGKTVIIVTHDMAVAKACHRIISIVDGMVHKVYETSVAL